MTSYWKKKKNCLLTTNLHTRTLSKSLTDKVKVLFFGDVLMIEWRLGGEDNEGWGPTADLVPV